MQILWDEVETGLAGAMMLMLLVEKIDDRGVADPAHERDEDLQVSVVARDLVLKTWLEEIEERLDAIGGITLAVHETQEVQFCDSKLKSWILFNALLVPDLIVFVIMHEEEIPSHEHPPVKTSLVLKNRLQMLVPLE